MAQDRPNHTAHLLFFLLIVVLFATARYGQDVLTGGGQDSEPNRLRQPDIIPDFASMDDIEARKAVFFEYLQPFIDAENRRILGQRLELERLREKLRNDLDLTRRERAFVSTLSEEYEIATVVQNTESHLRQLLRRVDIIPSSLVLAQAANESAWGTSRFAVEGNNFFGQWCYSEGCGLVPSRRGSQASHEVKAFASVAESVHAYFMNINTFPSYLELRRLRQSLREQGRALDSHVLAEGLDSYSARGSEYVEELRAIIRFNELNRRDALTVPLKDVDLSFLPDQA